MVPTLSEAPMTYAFFLLLFTISIGTFYFKPLYYRLVFHPYRVYRGQRVHTLFTSSLVHTGWGHLLVNGLFGFIFMSEDEYMLRADYGQACGSFLVLVFWLFTVFLCNFAEMLHARHHFQVLTVGLSAFTCASIEFYYLYFPLDPWEQNSILVSALKAYQLAIILLLILLMTFVLRPMRMHLIHLLGGIGGIVAAIIYRPILLSEIYHQLKP